MKFDLKEDDEITEAQINDILLQEEKGKIRNRAFRLLHHRQRSVAELRKRLVNIGFDRVLVDDIINEFVSDETLDDGRFAHAFASDYTTLKPKGNRFIFRELRKRGISQETIDELLRKRDERQVIRGFIQKKLHHLDMTKPKERQRMIQRLLYHGFTPDIIYDIIKERP